MSDAVVDSHQDTSPQETKPSKTQETKRPKRRPHIYARMLPADDDAYARLETVLTVIPVGRSTWWKGIKDGRFPAGTKFGPRLTMWKVADIRALLK